MSEQELFVSDIWQDCNWYVKPEPITVADAVAMFKGFDDDGVEYPDMTPAEYAELWNRLCLTDTPSNATISTQSKGESTMTEKMIAKLEAKGFNRWTKGNYDRLYINASDLGLVCTYYKTGNIHTAEFNGDEISNTRARAMKNAKTYIDVKTGKIYSDHDLLAEAAQELIDQAEAEIKAEEEAEAKKEANEEEYSAEEIAQTIVSNGETELALSFMGLKSREELYKKVGVNTDEEAIAEYIRRDNGGFRVIAFPLYMISPDKD